MKLNSCLLFVAAAFVSCTNAFPVENYPEVAAESVEVSPSVLSLKEGASSTLSVSFHPWNYRDGANVEWTSEDESIASVNSQGVVTAVSEGQTTVRAVAGELSGTCLVSVEAEVIPDPEPVVKDFDLVQTDALDKPTSFEEHAAFSDTIRVARGETATVQFIAYAKLAQGLVTPSITKFALAGSEGIAVEPSLHWVRDVVATDKWNSWFGGRPSDAYPSAQKNIPDALMDLEDWSVSLDAGSKAAFWAEFDIDRDLPAGVYEGTAQISGNQTATCDFVVKVYDVTLPQKQSLSIMQWMNQEVDAMGITPEMYAIEDLFENYMVPFVSRYGQNCFQSQYFQHNQTNRKLTVNEAGQIEMTADFSTLGKWIELYYRACPEFRYMQGPNVIASASRKSEGILVVSGLELDDSGKPKLGTDNGDGTYEPVWTYVDQKEQYSAEAEAYFSLYFAAMQNYLKSNTLPDGRRYIDVYLQTLHDEPDDVRAPSYERISSYIRKGGPEIKIMDPLGTRKIGSEYIDFPCPCINVMEGEKGYETTSSQTLWIYSANGPQGEGLNRFIRIPLIKTRLMHWLNYRYKASGYLHWGLNYWVGANNGDPWEDATRTKEMLAENPAGDMWIIWPGDHKVYPSLRLSAMRDGIRDYELLQMLAQKRGQAEADRICTSIVTDCFNYTSDLEAFRAARKAILDELEGR